MQSPNKATLSRGIVIIGLVLFQSQVFAKEWRFFPNLTVSETFSDNINLDTSGNEKSAFVTEVSPSIALTRSNGRNQLNLNYTLQGLYNAGGNDSFDINHQLQFSSNSILRRNSLFLGLRSSISQQNTTNVRAANDNLTDNRNRTNVYTYGISPTWTPNFNGYVNGVFRFDFSGVNTDNGLASDTKIYEESARLVSGWRFSNVRWFLDYRRRDEDRSNGNDVKSQNALGEVRLNLDRRLNVFGQVGYSDNQFQTTTNVNQNGLFYSVGGQWRPSRRFSVQAAYGNNSSVTVDIWPTRHMQWTTTYQHNKIGTNTGDVWRTNFNYFTKRSVWRASYFEDTTTTQTVLLEPRIFIEVNAQGEPVRDPETNQFLQTAFFPTLTDEVFIRKRADISYTYQTGKSNIFVRAFGEKRKFQVRQNSEDVVGITGSWRWQYKRRTALLFQPSWQHIERKSSGQNIGLAASSSNDDRFDILLSLTRSIPITWGRRNQLNARLEYRYLNQLSTLADNSFKENRITASLLLRF